MSVRILAILAAGFLTGQFLTGQISLADETAKSKTGKATTKGKAAVKHTQSKSPEDEAIDLVNKNSEVKQWLSEFKGPKGTNPDTQGRPAWQVEKHQGSVYLIRVLEDMPDRDMTFGFYDVNLKTKKVSKHED